jgi:hypothetical protein
MEEQLIEPLPPWMDLCRNGACHDKTPGHTGSRRDRSAHEVLKDNLSAANSRIKDVDVAEESTKFARSNILVQAGTAMLAQANAVPQSVLKLIQ